MYGGLDLLLIPLADVRRDDDVRAHGDAEEQIEEHVDDGRRAAHGGLVLAGGKLAEDGDVDSVEQLLQDAAERQRQREQDQFPEKRPVQHVDLIMFALAHKKIPS